MRCWTALVTCVYVGITSAATHSIAAEPTRPTQGLLPDRRGGQDLFGPYEVVPGWPKDISTVPGNSAWTYGAAQSVFAESPDRVFMLFRGELPKIAALVIAVIGERGARRRFITHITPRLVGTAPHDFTGFAVRDGFAVAVPQLAVTTAHDAAHRGQTFFLWVVESRHGRRARVR